MAALYLGLLSGTSADAIDAALVRFEPAIELVAAASLPYPEPLRARVLAVSQRREPVALEEYAALDVEIGRVFADAANALIAQAGIGASDVRAIGSHGQTLWHAPRADVPATLQAGDPNVVAERTGITTVADFRRRDVAAGGEGAPLMPAFHEAFLRHPDEVRVALNLGGIANVTVLAPGREVIGFDTGPANALLDAWAQRHLGTAHDAEGNWSRDGSVQPDLLAAWLEDPYFSRPGPKSTGRDYFNAHWLAARTPAIEQRSPADVQATLVALTTASVASAVQRVAPEAARVVVCGGGARNRALMQRLQLDLGGIALETSDVHGVPLDHVEAMGFAWLARETLEGRPGNRPSVTGARGARVLGAIYPR